MITRESALVEQGYDQAAPGFARSADRLVYSALASPLITAIKARLQDASGLILDVAAGTGAFGRAFTGVVALDLAASQLACNPASHRIRADANDLPFRPNSFAAAACAFGINHVAQPDRVVAEMARVAPVVGVSTWEHPERPFVPKQVVHAALERQVGRGRTPLGELLDRLNHAVGSGHAVTQLLAAAGLAGEVSTVEVAVPWPGIDAYLDYRLAMPSTVTPTDVLALRAEVADRLAHLPAEQLVWRAALVIGIGRRRSSLGPPPARSIEGTAFGDASGTDAYA